MSNQYEEHCEFELGAASEAQNCYTEAQGVRASLDESAKATALVEDGKFVVCYEYPYFCRATDALVGDVLRVVEAFDSREDAEALIFSRPEGHWDDGRYFVLPQIEVPAPAARDETEDDCPF
jgi:hypothetical protein